MNVVPDNQTINCAAGLPQEASPPLTEPSPGAAARGLLLRAFVPLTVGAVMATGFLEHIVFRYVKVDPVVPAFLSALVFALAISLVVSHVSRIIGGEIDHADSERRRAEETLRKEHADLELRIERRTRDLAETNDALQLDMVQRRQAEAALRQAEDQYRTIFENAVEGIFQTTPEGRYLKANPMLARIYDYESSEELMSALTDIENQLYVDPNRRETFMRLLQAKDAVWNFESEVYRKDGKVIWISENARAIRTVENVLAGYEGTVVDITERKRAEEELTQARRREALIGAKIQQTLLLGRPPQNLPGVQIATLTIPSQQIDGDFYDFFAHHDCFDVVVGDVMGKGVPAALLGAAIKSQLLYALNWLISRSGRGRLPEPEAIVTRVHTEVTGQFIGLRRFATLCYMRFDVARKRITFVDCGHTKTIHFRRELGCCELLEGENLPLGCCEQEIYRQVSQAFSPGDFFCFYSDGVTEAQNADGELFGVDRLLALVQANADLAPDALIARVRQAVVDYSGAETFADDLTCVIVRTAGREEAAPMAHAELEVVSELTQLALIRAFVRSFCRDTLAEILDEDSLIELELAVAEAASNIMRHAYHGRTDQWIRVEADAFPNQVAVRFCYLGDPFDPAAVEVPAFDGSQEGGFGVYIIAQCVDEVRYSQDEEGTNYIRLVKAPARA